MHLNGCVDNQLFKNNILEISFKDMNYNVDEITIYCLYPKKIFPHSTFYPQLRLLMSRLLSIL